MDFECKEVNLSQKCPLCKIMDVRSHEYQMEGFFYTCVILMLYLLLTTIFMVKIICLKRDDRVDFDEEQRRTTTNEVVKKFREREKQKALGSIFEIDTRRRFKKQMIGYLNSMNVGDINFNRRESQDDSATVITDNTSIMARSSYSNKTTATNNEYLKIDVGNEQSTQTTPKKSPLETRNNCDWKLENEQTTADDNKSDYSVEFYL